MLSKIFNRLEICVHNCWKTNQHRKFPTLFLPKMLASCQLHLCSVSSFVCYLPAQSCTLICHLYTLFKHDMTAEEAHWWQQMIAGVKTESLLHWDKRNSSAAVLKEGSCMHLHVGGRGSFIYLFERYVLNPLRWWEFLCHGVCQLLIQPIRLNSRKSFTTRTRHRQQVRNAHQLHSGTSNTSSAPWQTFLSFQAAFMPTYAFTKKGASLLKLSNILRTSLHSTTPFFSSTLWQSKEASKHAHDSARPHKILNHNWTQEILTTCTAFCGVIPACQPDPIAFLFTHFILRNLFCLHYSLHILFSSAEVVECKRAQQDHSF